MCVKRVSNFSRRLSKDAREFCISRRYFESEKKMICELIASFFQSCMKLSLYVPYSLLLGIRMLCGYEMPTFENPPC